jgi:hypothetical protein
MSTDLMKSHFWRPPGPSVASRIPSRRSRFSLRCSIVGGAVPRRIYCEGGLEEKAVYFFLAHREVADVREQPPAVAYIDQFGAPRRHTFDLLVVLKNGRKIAYEVKPSKFAPKWRPIIRLIASQMPRKFADAADVLTEKDLHPDAVHNAMLIHTVRRDPAREHDERMRQVVADLNGSISIRDLVEHSGLEGRGFRAIVRLIADGELDISRGGRIDYATVVSRPACATRRAG